MSKSKVVVDDGNTTMMNYYVHIEHLVRLVLARPELTKELEPTISFLCDELDRNTKLALGSTYRAVKKSIQNQTNAKVKDVSKKDIFDAWARIQKKGKRTKADLAADIGIAPNTLRKFLAEFGLDHDTKSGLVDTRQR